MGQNCGADVQDGQLANFVYLNVWYYSMYYLRTTYSMTKMDIVFRQECFLERDGQIRIPIRYLPEGEFVYPVTAINPFHEEIELGFAIKSNRDLQFKKKLHFSSIKITEPFTFSTLGKGESRDNEIIVSLNKGSKVWLHFPMSPRLLQKIETEPLAIKETVIKIISEIESEDVDVDGSSQEDSYQRSTPPVIENKQINGLELSHLKGIINLEQAEKQLDYVIYNKIFKSEKSRGFQKWKKSIYRKVVILLYKKLSKNPSRRVYFAKLYRNYVNNNIIADNFQAV